MKLLLLSLSLCLCSLLAGCAGTTADTDFRSKVKSVGVSATGATDGTNASGTVVATFELRDPRGLAK